MNHHLSNNINKFSIWTSILNNIIMDESTHHININKFTYG